MVLHGFVVVLLLGAWVSIRSSAQIRNYRPDQGAVVFGQGRQGAKLVLRTGLLLMDAHYPSFILP
jgi:hypothetical protein